MACPYVPDLKVRARILYFCLFYLIFALFICLFCFIFVLFIVGFCNKMI